jgi:chromosome partitioning protein
VIELGKAIAIFNQKGGVGKTTTNVNLSASLVKLGKRVLVIDNDPQGNSTSGLGVDKQSLELSLYDALIDDVSTKECIVSTAYEGLDVLPSNVDLAGAEIEMIDIENRESRLKNVIDTVKDQYDYIFVDCPPSLGLLTINSLVAVDSVLIPIQCEYYALEGVSSLMNTFQLIKKGLNPHLDVEGVVLSMYDSRTNLATQVVDEVQKYFGDKVFKTTIPKNVRLAEAPSFGMPVIEYDSRSKGAISYMNLAKEFVKKGR